MLFFINNLVDIQRVFEDQKQFKINFFLSCRYKNFSAHHLNHLLNQPFEVVGSAVVVVSTSSSSKSSSSSIARSLIGSAYAAVTLTGGFSDAFMRNPFSKSLSRSSRNEERSHSVAVWGILKICFGLLTTVRILLWKIKRKQVIEHDFYRINCWKFLPQLTRRYSRWLQLYKYLIACEYKKYPRLNVVEPVLSRGWVVTR